MVARETQIHLTRRTQFAYAGELDFLGPRIPDGGSVLEVGCGAGRMTRVLAESGYQVTAIDHSADMLAHVAEIRGVKVFHASIESMRLGAKFDAVLIPSFLWHSVDEGRGAMLTTCRDHLAAGGQIFIEWWPPEYFKNASGEGRFGPLINNQNNTVSADKKQIAIELEYRHDDGRRWETTVTTQKMEIDELELHLDRAGLIFGEWLKPDRKWFSASAL
ncbi:class I SAM-dependent methyltransferase [Streptomyces europaeiscabiei]|uniref:class I SAM-dependent methyltransferase n=1 Tax=Streptomyces europaeiscabiei TaxID=146819 RepID=UPI0029AC0937|nr:class I SAM-dependent methyltransferase [Streptomyces europaeiscabiei]MDX3697746.1 class I SAM-dependent methyltransferase [Streptomyces europaeiscabiei]